jgi:hypothetical protein
MDDEQRARILDEAFATLQRLEQREQNPPETSDFQIRGSGGHFDPWRAAAQRRAAEPVEPEPDLIYSEPVVTRSAPPAPAIEHHPVTAEDYIGELLAAVVAEVTATFDRKIERMQSEIDELKSDRSYKRFADKLDESIRTMDALAARFDRGHERSQVLDLPSWSTRTGNAN